MKNKRKMIVVAIISILLIMIVGLVFKTYIHYFYHEKKSDLYKIETSYRLENKEFAVEESVFQEGSGEDYFLEGLKAYQLENYYIAEENFEKALQVSHTDKALPTYVYYYLNQCAYMQEGAGDLELVSKAMDEATKYEPLANDTELLWDMISSISLSPSSDQKAIELMETYLQKQEHIELSTWARIKNCIGMLEYNNEEYAKAIREFYDVESMLEDTKLTPEIKLELRYAKEYIANIYYVFEAYEKAAMLYQELVENNLKDENFHSYGSCLNMASAYLEIDDTQNARKAMELLEENRNKIDAAVISEVDASMKDVLANICIKEGNFVQADTYLKEAEGFYNNNSGDAFLGGSSYILITRCKYLMGVGKYKEAQNILEEFVKNPDIAYYGLDKEGYQLLEKIYVETKQKDKLIEVYQKLQEFEKAFAMTTQQECLNFSEYYQENNQLKEHNDKLYRRNLISMISIIFISIILILVLLLVRFLSMKNVTDQLTGVYNRKKLNLLLQKYERNGTPSDLGVVMMDIDYFKRYNDTYGHQAGDTVLKEVAGVLKESVRKKDTVIRYGGEEFLVLLHGGKKKTAEEICQRIHERLAQKALPHIASEVSEHVTMSMGLVFQKEKNGLSLEKLIGNADECLYRSKEAGRNRLTVKED